MVQIIKHKTKKLNVFKLKCPFCKCEFKCDENDLKVKKYPSWYGYTIKCPECNNSVDNSYTQLQFKQVRG